jgi:hypothetical protein
MWQMFQYLLCAVKLYEMTSHIVTQHNDIQYIMMQLNTSVSRGNRVNMD